MNLESVSQPIPSYSYANGHISNIENGENSLDSPESNEDGENDGATKPIVVFSEHDTLVSKNQRK